MPSCVPVTPPSSPFWVTVDSFSVPGCVTAALLPEPVCVTVLWFCAMAGAAIDSARIDATERTVFFKIFPPKPLCRGV